MANLIDNAVQLADHILSLDPNRRLMIAIAGAPGSGKSTLADHLVEELNRREARLSVVFPMDGFHLDDAVLKEMGRLPYKGAIDTFDAHGLRHILQRLRDNVEDVVAVPVFDRDLEISRAGGRLIPQSTRIIVCEGIYLLMQQPPWDRLKPLFDLTVFVHVDEAELARRLKARWVHFGLDEDGIRHKLDGNDLPNGRAIIAGSAEPDIRIEN